MASIRKFSDKMLKYLTAPVKDPQLAFHPNFINNKWRGPKFSLRRQADLRKMCLLNNVDPESIGLPPKIQKKNMRYKPPKLHKEQREYASKQEAIKKALDDMPSKINEWKQNKLKELQKTKSSLPF